MCDRYGSRISGAKILLALQTSTNLYKSKFKTQKHKLQLTQITGYRSYRQSRQATCLRMSLAAAVPCAYKMSILTMDSSVIVFKAACQELQMRS